MTYINPLAGALAGQQVAQRALEAEKVRQARRARALSKNIAIEDDRIEHQVESGDVVQPAHPDDDDESARARRQPKRQGKRRPPDEREPPHIDLKA